MDTRKPIDESTGPTSLSASFNSDGSCFAVGHNTGFCVFNSDPCELKVSRDFNAGIGVAEMLGRTNYVAIVGGGRNPKFPQNKMVVWDDAKGKVALTLDFKTSVLRARLSRSHIVVILQNSVHLYEFSNPPRKISVFDTADNPLGLSCLGSRLVAFPGRSPGKVQLVELGTGNVSLIPAHNASLRALDLSRDEEVLVTASETGTLVRVFATGNCARIAELRRGVDPATMFSVAISPSNKYLAVTSDKSTLHVFDLPHSEKNGGDGSRFGSPAGSLNSSTPIEDVAKQKWGFLGKIPLMPRVFSDIYSFASARFEIGDDTNSTMTRPLPLGVTGRVTSKGVIGWSDDYTILVANAGRDGRWERFKIVEDDEGKRYCTRVGWKRLLGGG